MSTSAGSLSGPPHHLSSSSGIQPRPGYASAGVHMTQPQNQGITLVGVTLLILKTD